MNPKWMPGVAALMGLALAGPTTASAAGRDPYDSARSRDYRYDRYDSYAARVASGRGYEDGLNRGQRDGQHRDRFDVTRDGKYRDGDHGYKSSYGPRYRLRACVPPRLRAGLSRRLRRSTTRAGAIATAARTAPTAGMATTAAIPATTRRGASTRSAALTRVGPGHRATMERSFPPHRSLGPDGLVESDEARVEAALGVVRLLQAANPSHRGPKCCAPLLGRELRRSPRGSACRPWPIDSSLAASQPRPCLLPELGRHGGQDAEADQVLLLRVHEQRHLGDRVARGPQQARGRRPARPVRGRAGSRPCTRPRSNTGARPPSTGAGAPRCPSFFQTSKTGTSRFANSWVGRSSIVQVVVGLQALEQRASSGGAAGIELDGQVEWKEPACERLAHAAHPLESLRARERTTTPCSPSAPSPWPARASSMKRRASS